MVSLDAFANAFVHRRFRQQAKLTDLNTLQYSGLDDDCISLRSYIDNCAPVRRFRDIGFDYYLDVDADGNIVPQTN